MPTQVDGSGLDVDVHQVVDDLTLDVILDPVDKETSTDVYHLDEGEIPDRTHPRGRDESSASQFILGITDVNTGDSPVVLIRVQRLVAGFVAFNSPLEIQHGVCLVAVLIVWT